MTRAVVTHFFRPASGRPVIHSVTVIEEKSDNRDGKTYVYRTEYDVEWSRSYGYYLFHQSGGGGGPVPVSGIYHVSGSVEVKEEPAQWVDARDKPPWRGRRTRMIRKRNRTRRLNLPPKQIQLDADTDILCWLEHNGADVDAVWCSECKDMVRGDYLCQHTWWCDKTGWYSTPDERCACKDGEECYA